MKKNKQKRLFKAMLAALFAVSMIGCALLLSLTQAVATEAVGGLKPAYGDVVLGTTAIKSPAKVTTTNGYYMAPATYIYYGAVYDYAAGRSVPILWRVLDADHDNAGNEGAMFLFSEAVIDTSERISSPADDENIFYEYGGDEFLIFSGGRFENTYNGSYAATSQYPLRFFANTNHYSLFTSTSRPLAYIQQNGANFHEMSAIRPVTKNDSEDFIVDGFGYVESDDTLTVELFGETVLVGDEAFTYTEDENGLHLFRADGSEILNGRELSFRLKADGSLGTMMYHPASVSGTKYTTTVYQLTKTAGGAGMEGTYTAIRSYWITANLNFPSWNEDYARQGDAYTADALQESYVFPLSVAELEMYVANYNTAPGLYAKSLLDGNYTGWYLRTAYDNDAAYEDNVGYVTAWGYVSFTDADNYMGGRVGMNLDLSKIAFTRVVDDDDNLGLAIWEPTYLGTGDQPRFEASVADVRVVDGQTLVTVNYKNAITNYYPAGEDNEEEYISAMILREGKVYYYGTVDSVMPTALGYNVIDTKEYSAEFALPEDFDHETDTLYVFWERKPTDDRVTTFVSNMVEMDCVHKGGTATCVSGKICDLCAETYGPVDENNHTELQWQSHETELTHWQYCSACEGKVNEGECDLEATCTEVLDACTSCGRHHVIEDAHLFDDHGVCVYTADHYEPATLQDGVYLLASEGNLLWFAGRINEGAIQGSARITAEALDLRGMSLISIGSAEHPFAGTFDGAGVPIFVDVPADEPIRLFGYTAEATISGLALIGSGENTPAEGSALIGVATTDTKLAAGFVYLSMPLIGEGEALVENSFYLAEAATEDGGRTAARFASGEVAYALGEGWGQTLSDDPEEASLYPVFGGAAVYPIVDCAGNATFSNSGEGQDIHSFNEVVEFIWADEYCTACEAILSCTACDATMTVPCVVREWFYGKAMAEYWAEVTLSNGDTEESERVPFIVTAIRDVTAVEILQKTFDGAAVYGSDLMNNTQLTEGEYNAFLVPTGTVVLNTEGRLPTVEMTQLQRAYGLSATAAGTYDLVVIGLGNYSGQVEIFEGVLIIDKLTLELTITPTDRPADGTTDVEFTVTNPHDFYWVESWLGISLSESAAATPGTYDLTVTVTPGLGWSYYLTDERGNYVTDENGDYVMYHEYDGFSDSVELSYSATVPFTILQRNHVQVENLGWADAFVDSDYDIEIRIPYGTPVPTPSAEHFSADEGSTLTFEWYELISESGWYDEAEYQRLRHVPVNAGVYVLRVVGGATEDYVAGSLDILFEITVATPKVEINLEGFETYGDPDDLWYILDADDPWFSFNVTLGYEDTPESAALIVEAEAELQTLNDVLQADFPNAKLYFYRVSVRDVGNFGSQGNYESTYAGVYVIRMAPVQAVPESADYTADGEAKEVEILLSFADLVEGVSGPYTVTVSHSPGATLVSRTLSTTYVSFTVTEAGDYTVQVSADGMEPVSHTVSVSMTLDGEAVTTMTDVGRYAVTVITDENTEAAETAEVLIRRELRVYPKETSILLTDSGKIPFDLKSLVFEAGYLPMLGHTLVGLEYVINVEYGELEIVGCTVHDANGNDVSDLYQVKSVIYAFDHEGGLCTIHVFDNACDSTCNVRNCTKVRVPDPHEGGEATCCERAICDVCGAYYGNLKASNHESEETLWVPNQKDSLSHNLVHACCGAVISTEAHHVDVAATCTDAAICYVCHSAGIFFGDLDPANHTTTEHTYVSNGPYTHHVHHACCGAFVETVNHGGGDATCSTQAVCEHCGTSYGELDPDDHERAEEATYAANGSTHLATYPCCGVTVAEDHSGGTATCSAQAICAHCETAYGPLDPHNHASEAFTYALSPTSRARHTVSHACCGALVRTENHSGGTATCTQRAACEHCGTAYGRLDPTNHGDAGYEYALNVFDTSKHDVYHACCGEFVTTETHGGGTATCDVPAACAHCGAHYGETLEHTYDNACDYTCNVCHQQTRAMSFKTDEDGDGVCDSCGSDHGEAIPVADDPAVLENRRKEGEDAAAEGAESEIA